MKNVSISQIKRWAIASVAVVLCSCSQNAPSTGTQAVTEEEQVLQTSVFYPGELTPEASTYAVTAGTGETGTIEPPSGGSSGGDGGSIPAPGTGGGSDSGNTADGGGTDPGTGNSGGSTDGSTSGGTTADGGTGGTDGSTGTTDPGGSTDSGGTTAGGSDPGGSDGGTIDGGTDAGGGSDGGTVAGGGDTSGGTDGGTSGGTDGGTDGTTDGTGGNTDGGTDGTVADGGTGTDGSTDGGSSGGTDGTTDGGSDGGTVGGNDGTDGGSDGGTVADGGDTSGGTDGGTNGGTDGNTDGGTDGSTDGGTDGDGTVADGGDNGTDGNTDGGTNGGSDGGTDGSNDDGTVADGGDDNNGGEDGGTVGGGEDPNGGNDGGDVPQCVASKKAHKVKDHPNNVSKQTVCHIPPGNPANAHSISVGEPAVQAHLAHGDTLGHCGCPENMVDMKVKFSRICSQYRSGIPYPGFVFFEEAQNPLLSVEAGVRIEAQPVQHQDNRQLAGYTGSAYWYWKWNQQPVTYQFVPIHSVDLHGLNLFEGRHVENLDMALDDFRNAYPDQWDSTNITVTVCDDTNYNGLCSDEVYPYVLSINKPSFTAKHIPNMVNMEVWHGRHMLIRTDREFCEKQYSPIVLDLGGNGILLSGPGQGAVFDLNDTGTPVYTGWTKGLDDALLVRDVNGNGVIDSGAELFGSATRLKDGSRAPDGYAALAEWDADGDHKITPADPIWKELKVWLDQDSSGTSEPHELLSLDRVGMESMDLNYISMREVDTWGNETRMRSTFRRKVRGESRAMVMIDVWFNTLVSEADDSLAMRE